MKRNFAILTMMVIVAALFAGCGATGGPAGTVSNETAKNLADIAATQQKIAENYDLNDPAAAAKMMEAYGQFGAQMELQEFNKAESVDAPSDFPSSLIYGKGKVTESSDDSSDSYVNKKVIIKTTEDVKTVKDFYKNLFSATPWKITSQSSQSDGASYYAKDSANFEANADISTDPYSKIVTVHVYYSGDVTQ